LKIIITKLAYTLKLDTVSGITYAIMISVFIAQFFNTGLMLTLVNANFRDNSSDPDVSYWFSGSYTDFNEAWYATIGATLIKTMIISTFMPPIEFFGMFGVRQLKRILDRSFTSDRYKSKKANS